MAGQLALLFARRLHVPVVLTDVDQARLDKGLAAVHREIAGLAKKNRISGDESNRLTALITGSLDYQAFSDAEFVVEAVFEEISVKKQVFAELEKYVADDAVLATNTSSLSVTEMAADLAHPERVVGFHFFNPVAVMPLLEVIKADRTDDATLATAFAVAATLKKTAIRSADAPRLHLQPGADAIHGRGSGHHRRGHRAGRRRRRPGSVGAPDVAADAVATRRSRGGAARVGGDARRVPGPVPGVGEPASGCGRRPPHPAHLG